LLEEDAPVANTPTGGVRDALEADGVPGDRISGEALELEQ